MIERRAFLTGLVGIIASPAIVRAASLLPIKVVDLERENLRRWFLQPPPGLRLGPSDAAMRAARAGVYGFKYRIEDYPQQWVELFEQTKQDIVDQSGIVDMVRGLV